MKKPTTRGYGYDSDMFDDDYGSMKEAETAILEKGEFYFDYVVLTVKHVTGE
jgi:hypothetical protein